MTRGGSGNDWNSLKSNHHYQHTNILLQLMFYILTRCTSGCVVECRICNWEIAGLNHRVGYFAPRSTQPSIPPGSVNEYQLWLGRQRQVWLIPIADERVGVQVKLWNPLRTRAIPECFCGGDSLRRGAISSVCTSTLATQHTTMFPLICTLVRQCSCQNTRMLWRPGLRAVSFAILSMHQVHMRTFLWQMKRLPPAFSPFTAHGFNKLSSPSIRCPVPSGHMIYPSSTDNALKSSISPTTVTDFRN